MDISTKIFEIYTSFIAPEDIHVYSIDEVFMDVTNYLKSYKLSAHKLALRIIQEVLKETGITATAGIGTNLYLAKIAMDVKAKHMQADCDGVRIAELNEISYRQELWNHAPITDFWRIGPGYSRRLRKYGINTMGDLAKFSLTGSDMLYKEFGINAELLIDHAWGYEPVTITDIRNYRSDNHSISSGQVLSRAYDISSARIIISEMADELTLDLVSKKILTDQIVLTVGYDTSSIENFKGEIVEDRYGRKIPKHAHGTINLGDFTSSTKIIVNKSLELYDKIINPKLKVRRMYVVANHVKYDISETKLKQLDIFTDYQEKKREMSKEKRRQKAILKIKSRYGKNAILRGTNFEKGATGRNRNNQVGGHKA